MRKKIAAQNVDKKAATQVSQYDVDDREKLAIHREYLKGLHSDENERLKLIEAKSSQLFSQTGLIFTIMSLFLPLIIEKTGESALRYASLVLLLLAASAYIATISFAAANLNIKKYKYQRLRAEEVLNLQNEREESFRRKEVEGLLTSFQANVKLNNQKGTNLLNGYWFFRAANILTILLSLAICSSLVWMPKKKEPTDVRIIGLPQAVGSANGN